MQLIVLGMHRSGTSAITRLLNMAGAYFGPEGAATSPNEENPKGFWERRDLRVICDGLLQDSGFDWWRITDFDDDRLSPESVAVRREEFEGLVAGLDAHRPWVLKEPRLCLLLPTLRPALEVPVCIHVSREPTEVADSLAARNDMPRTVAVALWERYTLHALAASAGLPRYNVPHASVLADPVATLRALLGWLEEQGVRGLREPSEREITAFVDPALHRQRRATADRSSLLNEQQAALASAIDDGSAFGAAWDPQPTSPGGTDALVAFERAQEHREQITQLADQIRLLEQEQEVLRVRVDEVRVEGARAVVAAEAEGSSAVAEAEEQARARLEVFRDRMETEVEQARTDAAVADAATAARVDEIAAAGDELERIVGDGVRAALRALHGLERSTLWRTSERLMFLRQQLTPGMERQERGQIERIRADLDDVVQGLASRPTSAAELVFGEHDEVLPGGVLLRHSGPTVGSDAESSRPKIAVIAWDVGHNPLGRAYIMAQLLSRRFDVEVWGAQFERYGSDLWAPLRPPGLTVKSFEGLSLPDHLDAVEQVAERIDADAIWVSKPRFPSIALGVSAKKARNRPLVFDVDDHELAFFGTDAGLGIDELGSVEPELLRLPFERAWTRACDRLIGEADAVTVSNAALQERYGGTIVPHARDEERFDPERYDRERLRASLGVGPNDRLLLFGGTPRIHKGIIEVLDALEHLGDPRYRLALFGTRELRELRDAIGARERWILPLPYQRFEDLASIVAAADLSVVLQDPSHPVARYQMPAKVTDALAMGVPCLVRPVPPLQPLIDAGVLHVHDGSTPLHERIEAVFADPADTEARARRGRRVFLDGYSYAAVADRIAPLFEDLLDAPPPLSDALDALVRAPRDLFGPAAPEQAPVRRPGDRRWDAVAGEQYDLVMFWKQNDSTIYGRRQDMFLEYLSRSGRFANIVHFDNPISPESLYAALRSSRPGDQGRLVVRQTLRRLLRRADDGRLKRRTFVHAGRRSGRLRLPRRDAYPDHVAAVLEKSGVGKRLTVFWAYPANDDLPAVIDALAPDLVVADVVDDNRTWYTPESPHHDRIERNYREVLARSDVVLANCGPVVESMAEFAPEVNLVPNGCELPDGSPRGPRPSALAGIPGPIVGYVGNLSDRIDIDLLDDLCRARGEWQFVFVGSAHRDPAVLRLNRHPNAHFLGVRPYEQAKQLVRHFDVALIPHLDDAMTRSMNPLKAFVYCAAGVPVVSTPVANIEELQDLITVASGRDEFLAAIDRALASGSSDPDLEILSEHAWDRRVAQVMALVDRAAGAEAVDPAGGDQPETLESR